MLRLIFKQKNDFEDFVIYDTNGNFEKIANEAMPFLNQKMDEYKSLYKEERRLKDKRVKLLKEIREDFYTNAEEHFPEYFI